MAIINLESAVMATKSQAVTQVKYPEIQKPFVEQEMISREFAKQVEHNTKQPVKALKGENREFRYDAKEKGRNEHYGSSSSSKNKQTKDKKNTRGKYNSNKPGSIDIKI